MITDHDMTIYTICSYIYISHEISGYNLMGFMHLCPATLPFYPTLPLSECCTSVPLSLHVSLHDPESIEHDLS